MWFECGKVGILSMNDLTLMDDDTFHGMVKHIVIVLIIFQELMTLPRRKNNEQLGDLTRRKQVATQLN